jgi:Type II/IV secretion system protein
MQPCATWSRTRIRPARNGAIAAADPHHGELGPIPGAAPLDPDETEHALREIARDATLLEEVRSRRRSGLLLLGAGPVALSRQRLPPARSVAIAITIEYPHGDKRSIMPARGRHGHGELRQGDAPGPAPGPRRFLIGEMRDEETVRTALSAAETGHLVLSTLHSLDVTETVNRIIDFFSPHLQQQAG